MTDPAPDNFDKFLQNLKVRNADATSAEIVRSVTLWLTVHLSCDWASFWLVNGETLTSTFTWSDPNLRSWDLDLDTKNRILQKYEGMPGRAWKSMRSVTSVDIVEDLCLPRSVEAERAELHGGIWIPLLVGESVYGIFEIMGREFRPLIPSGVERIEHFGAEVGQFLEQRSGGKGVSQAVS